MNRITHFLFSPPAGASVDLKDESGQTALHKACGFGKLPGVKLLVNSGANVNDLEFTGQRPIHLASEEGRQDIVQYLLTKGAKCSVQDKDGRSPLHMCSKNGKCLRPSICYLLLLTLHYIPFGVLHNSTSD